jgi:quercetin dioxygenase-like cupin family protein
MASQRPASPTPLISFRQPSGQRRSSVTGAGYIYDKQPSQEIHGRTLRQYAIVYLLEGGGWFSDPSGTWQVEQGDVLVLFPNQAHSYYRGERERWSECWLMFQGPLFEALESDGLVDRATGVIHPGLHPALVAEFDELIRAVQSGDPQHQDVLTARCHVLLAELKRRHVLASASAAAPISSPSPAPASKSASTRRSIRCGWREASACRTSASAACSSSRSARRRRATVSCGASTAPRACSQKGA